MSKPIIAVIGLGGIARSLLDALADDDLLRMLKEEAVRAGRGLHLVSGPNVLTLQG